MDNLDRVTVKPKGRKVSQKALSSPLSIDDENCDDRSGPAKVLEGGDRSIIDVAFNLVNVTVGAGILGLPFALREAGFVFGIFLAVSVAYLTNFSLILMIYTGVRVEVFSFSGLARHAFGRIGFWLVNLIVFINGFGTMVSYLIIIGSTLSIAMESYFGGAEESIWLSRNFVITVCSLVFILPLLLWRSIGKLSKVSIVGVLCVPLLISLVGYRALINPIGEPKDVTYPFFGKNVFPAIGVMAFSFVSNQTAFLNFLSLKKQTIGRWAKSTTLALTISLMLSLSFAIIGYVAFGDKVEAEILSSFPRDDKIINLARLILGFSMFITYPMQFYPAREALNRVLNFKTLSRRPTNVQHYSVTLILFAICVIFGLLVSDLGIVFELVGGFCSTMIAYLLPGTACLVILLSRSMPIWISASDSRSVSEWLLADEEGEVDDSNNAEESSLLTADVEMRSQQQQAVPWYNFALSIVLIIFGGLAMVAGTGLTLLKLFGGHH